AEVRREILNQVPVKCHVILLSGLPGSGKSFLMKVLLSKWSRPETLIIVDGDSVKSIGSGTQAVRMAINHQGTISHATQMVKAIRFPEVVLIVDKNCPNVDDTARSWKSSKELKHWQIRVSNLRMS